MIKLLSSSPVAQQSGLAVIRIIVGLLMVYHGWEVFDASKIKEYTEWDFFKKFASPAFVVYIGKSAELLAGILMAIGLFTRLASLVLIATMLYIAFYVGSGKIWYEDQHPFLFVLLGLVYFFSGSGKWSVDAWLQKKKNYKQIY
ncbi:MAG TPA: DoxX family protein [Agriterribacter sp.]|nr:DoxX family protein [Agriterribacter sp.]